VTKQKNKKLSKDQQDFDELQVNKTELKMKVVVLNLSGNVGKSTIAGNLLKSRMDNAPIYSIGSSSIGAEAYGIKVEKMRCKEHLELISELYYLDKAIIDVRGHDTENFLKLVQQYDSHEEFDYFVIPVLKEKKVQVDALNTVRMLQKLKISADKIRIVFNKVDVEDTIRKDFASIFDLAESEKSFILNPDATIHLSELFEDLRMFRKSLADITADKNDYHGQRRSATSLEEKKLCMCMIGLKYLAGIANRNLDDVYKALFKPVDGAKDTAAPHTELKVVAA
jgi:MinD-like ATPase involved in chromosome partitioning or flagellar assembly